MNQQDREFFENVVLGCLIFLTFVLTVIAIFKP